MWLLTNKQFAPETLMTHRGLTSYAAGDVSKRITDLCLCQSGVNKDLIRLKNDILMMILDEMPEGRQSQSDSSS